MHRLAPLLLAAGCTIGVEVEDPPALKVEHSITIDLPDGGFLPQQCDNLANLEISKFIQGGFCTEPQRASYNCCGFVYNADCSISFCTAPNAAGSQFCVVVGTGCHF